MRVFIHSACLWARVTLHMEDPAVGRPWQHWACKGRNHGAWQAGLGWRERQGWGALAGPRGKGSSGGKGEESTTL